MKHERGKIGTALLFAVLIATLACVSIGTASVAEPHYVNSGESIQGAIDNATAGDTIIVRDGTYTENVNVNVDHLTLKSEHGYDSTVVHAANTSDHVFEVTANYVNITGFTVTDATGAASDYIYTCGIHLYQAEHCIISDNNALNNWRGIYLVYSSNNSLMNNTAKGNSDVWIFLYSSSNNSLMDNTVNDNKDGIYLSSSCNYNTLSDNTATNNTYGGIYLSSSCNNSLMDNTINDNNNGIYLYSSCNYNLIYNNYFNNTNNARDSGNNTWNITKTAGTNIIGGPYIGGNYWSNYAGEDLTEDGLGDTLVPYNSSGDIANGGDLLPLVKPSASSVFDTGAGTYPSIMGTHEGKAKSYLRVTSRLANCTPTTAGSTYTDNRGNYWGDYTGTDGNGDGLGDSPYRIDSDKDDYPLMVPRENYLTALFRT